MVSGLAQLGAYSTLLLYGDVTDHAHSTLVPCPTKDGGAVDKEEELIDDLFESADLEPVLQHGAPSSSFKSLFNPESIVPSSTQRSVNMAADVSR